MSEILDALSVLEFAIKQGREDARSSLVLDSVFDTLDDRCARLRYMITAERSRLIAKWNDGKKRNDLAPGATGEEHEAKRPIIPQPHPIRSDRSPNYEYEVNSGGTLTKKAKRETMITKAEIVAALTRFGPVKSFIVGAIAGFVLGAILL